ncbi:unnamed protein product [Staurois parvus]|uniref:Uncharacterized protein n=1 Tax=Staurois parvus TaxID=386267 RepID=A0ABN9EGB1_9NEOB|nr:unnamed protein product [Staurois parvus]
MVPVGLPLCCRACNLPWAPYRTPHAAARPHNLAHGPLYRLSSAGCQVHRVSWVTSTASHSLLVSIATLCHGATFRSSSTLLVVSIFVIRVLYGLPLLAASTATLWLHHSGLGPWTGQNDVKCAVILRSTALICHVNFCLTVLFLFVPADSKGHLN